MLITITKVSIIVGVIREVSLLCMCIRKFRDGRYIIFNPNTRNCVHSFKTRLCQTQKFRINMFVVSKILLYIWCFLEMHQEF